MMEARIVNMKTQTARCVSALDRDRHARTSIIALAARAVLMQVIKRTHAPATTRDSSDAMLSGAPVPVPVS
ncbi:hypothetical protein WI95_35010 [Burkholderia contaminans]|nr:hypothetical protein WI95_35010 [Burkholderia contaminans]TCW69837.1 hypothetical protein C5O79_14705 [Burkholderia sp. SRS-25]